MIPTGRDSGLVEWINNKHVAKEELQEHGQLVGDGEYKVHVHAQDLIKRRQVSGQVYKNGVDILKEIEKLTADTVETSKSTKSCEDNEIYIVDGNRTLLLTNKQVADDINLIQKTENNLMGQLQRQDRVIEFLKKRLNYSETQMDESMKVLEAQERTYMALVGKVNTSSARLNSVKAQNKILEDQHEQDRVIMTNNRIAINEMRSKMDEKDRLIEDLKRQVGKIYIQVEYGVCNKILCT